MRREEILGFQICAEGVTDCLSFVAKWVEGGDFRRYFACANPHSLELARMDAVFREALQGADLLTPDGVGIVLASRIMGGSICERVTGADVFVGVTQLLHRTGGSVFFLGSTEENLAEIRRRMGEEYPNVRVAGTYSPPFKAEFTPEDNRQMVSEVNRVRPDVLWVGMTAPKQEKWVHANLDRLDVKFVGAIGAVFDFYTGKVKRSHPLFQRLGLEWLPRLLSIGIFFRLGTEYDRRDLCVKEKEVPYVVAGWVRDRK
jgi:N-acetylglucosaminyldiphosphoundecaprenol N-acetyl-beta-D-mannosaminyltransferase